LSRARPPIAAYNRNVWCIKEYALLIHGAMVRIDMRVWCIVSLFQKPDLRQWL